MRIQRRITLGIGILFTMILSCWASSPVGYVRQLSRATRTILADNYNSAQYAGEILRSLSDIGRDSISRHALRENLALQQQNITEISEKETTAALERRVASLSDPVTEAEIRTVREDLFRIMELNMAAIRAKSAGVGGRRLRHVVADRRRRALRPDRRGHPRLVPAVSRVRSTR